MNAFAKKFKDIIIIAKNANKGRSFYLWLLNLWKALECLLVGQGHHDALFKRNEKLEFRISAVKFFNSTARVPSEEGENKAKTKKTWVSYKY